MVREGDPTAVEGTLSIEGATLVFVPSAGDGEQVRLPASSIRRVRRGRGSPLLSLSYRDGEGVGKLFVYFAKPPPLPGSRPSTPPPLLRWPRGLERSAAALAMGASKRLLKRDIDAWVQALRELREGG
jgi:hypothetical protein